MNRAVVRALVALIVWALLIPATPTAQDPAGSVTMQVLVKGVWVHDVPPPPQGDFWDPVLGSVIGLFAGRAGIYPDVTVCARPANASVTGRIRCAPVCVDLQGDSTINAESTACQRPLEIALPVGDPRMVVEIREMDDQQLHALIARNVMVADPTQCPDAQPCRFEVSQGRTPLVLSFTTETVGRLGPPPPARRNPPRPAANQARPSPPPARCQPSQTWSATEQATPAGLHGPYPSVDGAAKEDSASVLAFNGTYRSPTESEYGFLIVRDQRQAAGGYYTTPPVGGTAKADATARPQFSVTDYQTSLDKAFGTCDYIKHFAVAATVHTHPNRWYPSNSFSADDFTQAGELKRLFPAVFEKIVMINAKDRKIRTFAPDVNDPPFSSFGTSVTGVLPYLSILWMQYAWRVEVIHTYP